MTTKAQRQALTEATLVLAVKERDEEIRKLRVDLAKAYVTLDRIASLAVEATREAL